MENIDYETLHKYTQQVCRAKTFVSSVSGEEIKFSAHAKILYLTLLSELFVNEGEISISQDRIAEMTGFDRKTVISALKTLRENSVIDCEKRPNKDRGFSQWVYLGVQFPLVLKEQEMTKTTGRYRKNIPHRVRFEVFRKSNFCCSYCGRKAVDGYNLVVDHIHPVAKGGTNDIDNLTSSCEECNSGKGDTEI